MLYRIFAITLLTASLIGCASNQAGPIGTAQFDSLAKGQLRPGSQNVLLATRAAWAKDAHGYMVSTLDVSIAGVLVLSDTHLAFSVWHEERQEYLRMAYIPYADVAFVEVASFGMGRRLVVRSRDASQSFELLTEHSTIDRELTEKAAAIITSKLSGKN